MSVYKTQGITCYSPILSADAYLPLEFITELWEEGKAKRKSQQSCLITVYKLNNSTEVFSQLLIS